MSVGAPSEPSRLDFPPLNCSLCRPLGDYYQDFLPALELVETGYHGTLDARGVPRVRIGDTGERYLPVAIAQYALANASALIRGDRARTRPLKVLCDWLVDNQRMETEYAGLWMMDFDNVKYPWLQSPWASALAQGNAISALLRAAELLGDQRYADAALAGYHALHGAGSPLLLVRESGDELWYEEYPAREALHVLNGHVYTLFGILDVARTFGEPGALDRWRRGARTLAARLRDFDLGYWSAYDLRTKEPVGTHYHKNIHIPQLRILGILDGDPIFDQVADRWERYLSSVVARLRCAFAMRRNGLRRRLRASLRL
ncbi:MAG: D-glucuronyl C5-epimerase family protein [Vicinamibacteria bacterium]